MIKTIDANEQTDITFPIEIYSEKRLAEFAKNNEQLLPKSVTPKEWGEISHVGKGIKISVIVHSFSAHIHIDQCYNFYQWTR